MINFICNILIVLSIPICDSKLGIGFEEVKNGLMEKSINLIDVRTIKEVKTLGKIPGSNNLPCK